MEKSDSLLSIFKQLDEHFLEYLSEFGRTPDQAGFINCINPNHPDRNPSMHIVSAGHGTNSIAHCFSCQANYNILHAAYIFEKKPLSGVGFYQETLPHLCKKFGIRYEPIEIDERQKELWQIKRALTDAVNTVHSSIYTKLKLKEDHPGVQALLSRGITENTIREFKIGVVESHSEYLNDMKNLGWDKDFLTKCDLTNKGIFIKDAFIIPILDTESRPVGFVSRTTKMAANDKGQSKYVNSQNNIVYCKGEILFNLDKYDKTEGPLYIVEGYMDAIYLHQCGLKNVAAIGSTALTEQHTDLLMNLGIKDVILCFDADEGGSKGLKLAIDRLSPYKFFRTKILELPEGYDPDLFVRDKGLEEFKNKGKPDCTISPFTWLLKQHTFEDDPLAIVKEAIPAIAAEDSNITRLELIRELSRVTSVPEIEIKKDVDSLVSKDASKFIEEVKEISNWTQVQLTRKSPKDVKGILQDSLTKIRNIEIKWNNIIDPRTEYENAIQSLKDKINTGNFKYGLLSPRFSKLEKMFDGIPDYSNLILVGGRPSSGKTTFLINLSRDIVDANADAAVFFMSIDDTADLMNLKLLAIRSGLSTSEIKRYHELDKEKKKLVSDAWDWLDNLKHRYVLADAKLGKSPEVLESHVDWFIKEYANYRKVIFLDNFHKLTKTSRGANKATDISDLSERIKDIVQLKDIPLIMTVELRKLEGSRSRPDLSDLKDSVQMEYDAEAIILVHNDYQVAGDETNIFYHEMLNGEMTKMPYLEINVAKNKMNGQTGKLAYKLNKHNLRVTEDKWSTIQGLLKTKSNCRLDAGGF